MKVSQLIIPTLLTLTCNLSADIKLNPLHEGSILHFPAYYAIGSAGWHTNIRIANTNEDRSIVAKLVIRESTHSVKKLDMLLFLGPTDVFDADIREINGTVVLATVDDSHALKEGDLDNSVYKTELDEIIVPFKQARVINDVLENNNFGTIEVYGLVENNNTEVDYSDEICVSSENVKFDRNSSVSGVTCNGESTKYVYLASAGTEKEKFEKAALTTTDATRMGENGWSDVKSGLIGEAIIMSNNTNGHLAMAYQAQAFYRDDANEDKPYSDIVTPAAQRYQDTNLLMYNDASLIASMENAIAKDKTYVTHYAKDGRLPSEENDEGDMAETRLLVDFMTKKYSVEQYNYESFNPYSTYGINYAGGNLFKVTVTPEKIDNIENSRSIIITTFLYSNYRAHASKFDTCDYQTVPIELCSSSQQRIDTKNLLSIDVRNDSPFADGYINYKLTGAQQRKDEYQLQMPYIPLVMSAVSFKDGVNVVNIKYPASHPAKITRQGEVGFYSVENATAYDISPKEDGLIK